MKKHTLLSVLSVALILFSMLSAVTFAWLSSRYTVEKSTEIQLDGNMVASTLFDAYKYNTEEGLAGKVTGDDVTLPLYDTVFTEKNEDCTLIYRVPVFGSEIDAGNAFTITLTLADKSDVTGLDDYNYKNGDKAQEAPAGGPTPDPVSPDAIADYVSNVIYVKCAVISSLQAETVTAPADWTNDSADDYLYRTAHNYFKNTTSVERLTFVTGETADNATTYSKDTDAITFTVQNYKSAMAEGATILYVYIEVGYDVALVDNMTTSRNASFSFDGEEKGIPIESDLKEFVFSPAKSA